MTDPDEELIRECEKILDEDIDVNKLKRELEKSIEKDEKRIRELRDGIGINQVKHDMRVHLESHVTEGPVTEFDVTVIGDHLSPHKKKVIKKQIRAFLNSLAHGRDVDALFISRK